MRTAGLTMNDVWADRVLHERGAETYRYEGLSADIGVFVESVELRHRSKDENYRPYLHIAGELRRLTPAHTLPFGISEVTYCRGQGEKVDAFYEFDDQQLLALTSKGYFSSAFAVPEHQFTGIEWELPATMDALVLAPTGAPADVPVVFTQVHDIAGLEIDLTSSGYDLTDYFDEPSRGGATRVASVVDERVVRARLDAIDSLFPDEELNSADPTEPNASAATVAETETEVIDTRRLQQVEEEIEAERERYRVERKRTQGTPENLYHTYVAVPLGTAVDLVTTSPGSAPTAHLDLEREDQETRPGRNRHVPAFDERRRELSPRADDVGAEGHDLGS